jgi:hypothetical protein
MFETVFIFTLGMLSGGAIFVGYGFYQLKKLKRAKAHIVEQFKKHSETVQKKELSIKDRLIQAHELAKMQVELKAMAEMPSKNALHSNHKNGLISEIMDLERQKIDILRSILGDGIDPLITVINPSGVREDILLSAYIGDAEATLEEASGGTPPKTSNVVTKKIGKFMVIKGGKDDGTSH